MYQQVAPPPTKSKWKTWHKVVLVVLGGLIAVLCCGGVLVSVFPDKPNHLVDTPGVVATGDAVTPAGTSAAPVSKAAARPAGLSKADVQLSVKITKKECFGSAGCNVQFEIKAAVVKAFDSDYTVTYDVHGLDDVQTAQLTLHPDGTYEQDRFAFGSTTSSSKKLTATVTDLEKA